MKVKERESKFELLRIVSMVMIMAGHYCYHGGLMFNGSSSNWMLSAFLKPGGKLGVTCFALISGYFMGKKDFDFMTVIKVACQTVFYSILWTVIIFAMDGGIGIKAVVRQLFSPVYGGYWYVTAYLSMCLLTPLLNLISSRIEKSGGGYSYLSRNHCVSGSVRFC